MRCRSCFDFEVIAINGELTLRSQIISSDGDEPNQTSLGTD
jgi:hypothetical protein